MNSDRFKRAKVRQPGIEPGPLPWKGRILTIRPLTLFFELLRRLVKGETAENASPCGQTLQLGRCISHLRRHNRDGSSGDRMYQTVRADGFCDLVAFRETFPIPSPLTRRPNPNTLRNVPNSANRVENSLSFAIRLGKNVAFSSSKETTIRGPSRPFLREGHFVSVNEFHHLQ